MNCNNTAHHTMKLHVCGFAFASALTWAISVFILGMMSMNMNWGNAMMSVLASIYVGFAPTWMGCLIGAGWAFAFSFVAGLIVAWIYNRVACCCCCKKDSNCTHSNVHKE